MRLYRQWLNATFKIFYFNKKAALFGAAHKEAEWEEQISGKAMQDDVKACARTLEKKSKLEEG